MHGCIRVHRGAHGALRVLVIGVHRRSSALTLAAPAFAPSAAGWSRPSRSTKRLRARSRRTRPSRSRRPTSCAPRRCCSRRARRRHAARSAPTSPTPRSTAAASFGEQTVQPQNQSMFGLSASMPVLAAAQWAARTQAMDQVEIARLSVTDTRRQIAVATASAYLAVIAQKRQVDVSLTAIETARGQLDYNTRRREGGVGSRLNELRSAQVLAATRGAARGVPVQRAARAGSARRAARGQRTGRCQRRAGVRGPADDGGGRVAAESSGYPRVHRAARRQRAHRQRQPQGLVAGRVGELRAAAADAVRNLPAVAHVGAVGAAVAADLRRRRSAAALRREREAIFEASTLSLEQVQIEARSEVRIARAAVESRERALASARQRVARRPTRC